MNCHKSEMKEKILLGWLGLGLDIMSKSGFTSSAFVLLADWSVFALLPVALEPLLRHDDVSSRSPREMRVHMYASCENTS